MVALLFAASAYAQAGLGFNGSNWFEAQTPDDLNTYLSAIEQGDLVSFRWRTDKTDDPMAELPYMVELLDSVDAHGADMRLVVTIDVDAEAASNTALLLGLVKAGHEPAAVEMDNEYYSEEPKLDAYGYAAKAELQQAAMMAAGIDVPVLLFLAPRPKDSNGDGVIDGQGDILGGRGDHQVYDDTMVEQIQAHHNWYPVIHIYYGGREVAGYDNIPAKRPVQLPELEVRAQQADLVAYHQALYDGAAASDLFEATMHYLERKLPGSSYYVTEFGYNAAGDTKNTIGYTAGIWVTWQAMRDWPGLAVLQEHNGIARTLTGCISPAVDQDEATSGNVVRQSFYCYQLVLEAGTTEPLPADLSALAPGVYRFHYANVQASGVQLPVKAGSNTITWQQARCVAGSYVYSSSGACAFMDKGSEAGYEVDGIKTVDDAGYLPPYSYGYIVAEVKRKPPHPVCRHRFLFFCIKTTRRACDC